MLLSSRSNCVNVCDVSHCLSPVYFSCTTNLWTNMGRHHLLTITYLDLITEFFYY